MQKHCGAVEASFSWHTPPPPRTDILALLPFLDSEPFPLQWSVAGTTLATKLCGFRRPTPVCFPSAPVSPGARLRSPESYHRRQLQLSLRSPISFQWRMVSDHDQSDRVPIATGSVSKRIDTMTSAQTPLGSTDPSYVSLWDQLNHPQSFMVSLLQASSLNLWYPLLAQC